VLIAHSLNQHYTDDIFLSLNHLTQAAILNRFIFGRSLINNYLEATLVIATVHLKLLSKINYFSEFF
jgi:hypothetical protein